MKGRTKNERYRHGGIAKRADGGRSPPNPGEVSNKESAKYLRDKAGDDLMKGMAGSAAGTLAGAPFVGRGRHISDAMGLGATGSGVAYGVKKGVDAFKGLREAAAFEKADADDKQPDASGAPRKRGGRAKR